MKMTELLRVLQFGDSTLPVGAFAFSNGLESALQAGAVTDAASLRDFVLTARRVAASDGIALLHAHRAALAGDFARIACADRAAFNRKLNEEQRTMSVRMGKKLAELGQRVLARQVGEGGAVLGCWLEAITAGRLPGTFPAGLGVLFAELGAPEAEAFAVHQYGVASMILGAALRLMKVSHLDTQAILFAVNQGVEDEYTRIRHASLEDMASFAPLLDILAAVHVKAHVRMFMN